MEGLLVAVYSEAQRRYIFLFVCFVFVLEITGKVVHYYKSCNNVLPFLSFDSEYFL